MRTFYTLKQCLAMTLALILSACLPDGEAARQRELAEFARTQASAYAASFASYAVKNQEILSDKLADKESLVAQGRVGTEKDGSMAYGYCVLENGGKKNHMAVAWMDTHDSNGFTIKGLGTEAGTSILFELMRIAPPETIGYYKAGALNLRGPRSDGTTSLSLTGCNLGIPTGAPIMIAEDLGAPDVEVAAGQTFEYRTSSCSNKNDIGVFMERRAVTIDENGKVEPGDWHPYDEGITCGGEITLREISITESKGKKNLIGALNVTDDNYKHVLEKLTKMDCIDSTTTATETDESGKEVKVEKIVSSCNAKKVDVKEYAGPSNAIKGEFLKNDTMDLECGGMPALPSAQAESFTIRYAGRNLPGTRHYSAWSGKVTYIQPIYKAIVKVGDASKDYKDTTIREKWQGGEINCSRTETLKIGCEVFDKYSGERYQKMNQGGLVFKRTNKIEGWEDPKTFTPKSGLKKNEKWELVSADCSWYELKEFTCPEGEGLKLKNPGVPGVIKRLIKIELSDINKQDPGEWKKDTPLECVKIDESTEECSTTARQGREYDGVGADHEFGGLYSADTGSHIGSYHATTIDGSESNFSASFNDAGRAEGFGTGTSGHSAPDSSSDSSSGTSGGPPGGYDGEGYR